MHFTFISSFSAVPLYGTTDHTTLTKRSEISLKHCVFQMQSLIGHQNVLGQGYSFLSFVFFSLLMRNHQFIHSKLFEDYPLHQALQGRSLRWWVKTWYYIIKIDLSSKKRVKFLSSVLYWIRILSRFQVLFTHGGHTDSSNLSEFPKKTSSGFNIIL